MNWRTSLDRWLTTDPNESADCWFESLIDSFTDSFYDQHEAWFDTEQYQAIANRLLDKEKYYQQAAAIIERWQRIFGSKKV